MELNLQFGWGMMEHSRTLVRSWSGGIAILSPRDLDERQLLRLSTDIRREPGGGVFLDPQLYLPRSDHERLRSHSYWPSTYATGTFWSGSGLRTLIDGLGRLNEDLQTQVFIAPSVLTTSVSDDWGAVQKLILDEAFRKVSDSPVLATIALSADVVRDENQIAQVIEETASWKAEGVYVVVEHPNGSYLVSDAEWLANVVDLCAGLKLQGKSVFLGYSNHQMLIAAAAKVDAIASGTWMNVRSFPPNKFRRSYDDEIKQRTTWYYCPQALSEYKLPFLDIARRQGCLHLLRPDDQAYGSYANDLFRGGQPTTVGFSEAAAFRHYLHCLHAQAVRATKSTFDETFDHHERMLDKSEALLGELHEKGIRGQLRDFLESIDVNRAALAVLKSTRGAILRRKWADL